MLMVPDPNISCVVLKLTSELLTIMLDMSSRSTASLLYLLPLAYYALTVFGLVNEAGDVTV